MSPRVSRGLGSCSPSLLMFNAKTYRPLCRISFSSSVSSREISVVVSILHVFCKFMRLHNI